MDEYLKKQRARMDVCPIYDESYTLRGEITKEKKQQQRDDLENSWGYVD
jgi:maltose O-acetyltransferase